VAAELLAADHSAPVEGGPLVSMIMATNRVSPFLREALDSITRQSYPDVEIIVVDDGCPDRVALAEQLGRFPGLVVVRQRASGVSVARNVGIDRARGALVGFFDDDDRYPPDWVEQHVRAHTELPEVTLTYGDVRSIDADGRLLGLDVSRQADLHDIFRRDVAVFAGSMVVRRDALVRVGGFSPLLRYAEDLDLVLRLALQGPLRHVAGAVMDYRTHADNVTRGHRELVAAIGDVIDWHRAAALRAGRDDLVRDLATSRAANGRFAFWSAQRVARTELRSGGTAAAVRELLWAVRAAPTAPLSWLRKRLGRRS